MKRCLFAFGSGLNGQLGLGREITRTIEPLLVSVSNSASEADDVALICASADHSYAVRAATPGIVHGTSYRGFSPKTEIASEIAKLACGKRHLLVLDRQGTLHGAGANDSGQLGASSAEDVAMATPIVSHVGDSSAVVVDVSAGLLHSLAVTSDGALFSCGASSFNELGHASIDFESRWRRVEALSGEPVIGCAAGALHSVAWTASGRLFSFGRNDRGQLGTRQSKFGLLAEVRVPAPVRTVACGHWHTVVATVDGRVFVCGDNEMRQLGEGAGAVQSSAELAPVELPSGVRIRGVACGSYHSLAWSEDGRLFAWGAANDGQLGVAPAAAAGRVVEVRSSHDAWQHIESAVGGFGLSLAISRSKPI